MNLRISHVGQLNDIWLYVVCLPCYVLQSVFPIHGTCSVLPGMSPTTFLCRFSSESKETCGVGAPQTLGVFPTGFHVPRLHTIRENVVVTFGFTNCVAVVHLTAGSPTVEWCHRLGRPVTENNTQETRGHYQMVTLLPIRPTTFW